MRMQAIGLVLTWTVLGCSLASAETPASTAELPPALLAVQSADVRVLSETSAAQVRGQATQSEILAAAANVAQRSTVTELPGGVNFFSGFFFDPGLLINTSAGRGGIFNLSTNDFVRLSNLQGNYIVFRDSLGRVNFLGQPTQQ